MANWTSPTNETFLPDLVEDIKARDVDTARMFDSGVFSNIPENSIRFNVDEGVMQRWESGNWVNRQFSLDALPNINSTTGVFGSNIQIPRITVNNKGLITNVLAQNIRAASTSQTGVVQLNDSITSTSTTQAATPNAVRQANLRNQPQTLSGSTTNQMSETGHSHALAIASDNDAETGSGSGLVTPPKVKIHVDNRLSDDIEDDSSDLIASSKLVNDLANSKLSGDVLSSIISRNWVEESNAAGGVNTQWQRIAWSPKLGIFVAVAFAGTNRLATSSDGVNWVARSTVGSFRSVTWSDVLEIFIATVESDASGNNARVSEDGIVWTNSALSGVSRRSIRSLDGTNIVLTGSAGSNIIDKTTDGLSWEVKSTPSIGDIRGIAYSESLDRVVAVGSGSTNKIIYSDDKGETWTLSNQVSELSGSNAFYKVERSEKLGLFVAVTVTGFIITSGDGIDWDFLDVGSENFYDLVWSEKLGFFTAVGSFGTNRLYTSFDGVNWTPRSIPSGNWFCLGVSDEMHMVVGLESDFGDSKAIRTL